MDEIDGMSLLSARSPAAIAESASNIAIDAGSVQINQNSGLRLTFSSPIPLPQGCILKLKLIQPAGQSFASSSIEGIQQSLKYIYAYGMFGSNIRSLPFSFEDSSTIRIGDACNTHSLVNDQEAILKIKYFRNPDTVRDSDYFQL